MSSAHTASHDFENPHAPLRNRGLMYQVAHNPVLIFASLFLSLCFWTFVSLLFIRTEALMN